MTITTGTLTQIADRDGVDMQTVEKDYVLAHLLSSIYRVPGADQLDFKGGTFLRACVFEEYRYSADLDFSLLDITVAGAIDVIEMAAVQCREEIGFDLMEPGAWDGGDGWILYRRPSGSDGKVKVNLAEDELADAPDSATLIPRYEDLDTTPSITAYGLSEVLAEKFRCVMQRMQARDLYDIYRLLPDVYVPEAWEVFVRKAEHKGLDPTDFSHKLDTRLPAYKKKWTGELPGFMADVPEFDEVVRKVRAGLRGVQP